MALNATQSVDILFKKVVASKATTTTSKQYFEEGYTSVSNVINNYIWLQSDEIPNTATTSSVTQFISVTMSYISGSNGAFYDPTGTLTDIIPFGYGDGSSYNYQIFRNNGITTISSGQSDWFFDNNSGILTFFSGTLTSGTIVDDGPGGSNQTLATDQLPPIAKVWKYVGKKGVIPNLNGLTYSGGTMSINIGAGLTLSNGQLTVSGSNGTYSTTDSAGRGLTKSGNTFSVLLDGVLPGLTVSSNGLKIIDLIMTTSSVTLDTNILGKYTTDPTTLSGWNYLSIPTKSYVDAVASGLTLKQAVRVAATGSITILSAPSQIDGVTAYSGDRILLWKQDGTVNGTSSNGIYIYNGAGASMSRAADMDGNPSSEVSTGVYTFVTEGNTYQGSGFVVVASGTVSGQIQVGTQSMKWTQFSSAGNYIWNNGIIVTGNVVDIDLFNNGGLTFSSGQLKIDLRNNSGLSINNGLYIDTTFAGTGLTMNNGVMSVNDPILASSGLTNSGITFSVNINTNGLTFSSGKLSLNIGTGLTFSSNQLGLNFGDGLTFSSSKLNVLIDSTPSGLTLSSTGIKVRYNQTSGLNIYSSGGPTDNQLYIDWSAIIGNGLTWSGASLNTNSAVITKYAVGPLVFTASVTQTITHNIGNLEYIIQMYSSSTGEEILSQYSNRTSTTIDITMFEDTSDVKIIVIG